MSAATLPVIPFTTLRSNILQTHTPSSARAYVAMLTRLETFVDTNFLDLNNINADFVAAFGDYLIRCSVKPSTVKLFKKALRAILKPHFGTENRSILKNAFKDVGSANETDTNSITSSDLAKIAAAKFPDDPYLKKTLDTFLFSVIGAGQQLNTLKTLSESDLATCGEHRQHILTRHQQQFGTQLTTFIATLSDSTYTAALNAIGSKLSLSRPLTPKSSIDAWIAAALAERLDIDLIAAATAEPTSLNTHILPSSTPISRLRINAAHLQVANRIIDLRQHWHVMKCRDCTPDDIKRIIDRALPNAQLDQFVAPTPARPKNTSRQKDITGDLLFFRCTTATAADIRRTIAPHAWVYTQATGTEPARIPDREMMTFMLLCNVNEGTITYHFPDATTTAQLHIGQQARITNGNFSGLVGIISALPDNRYKVVMTLTGICARVTAEVPTDFIQLL